MERLSFEKAKELSIRKWEAIVKNKGEYTFGMFKDDPEIDTLFNKCGLCERYSFRGILICRECEFNSGLNVDYIGCACNYEGHIYRKWTESLPVNKLECAKEILEILKNLKPKEDEKEA